MAKRFTETTIWEDDWFYELSPEYKLFWFYIKDNCDYAGIWKPKPKIFQSLTDVEVNLNNAIKYFNVDKQRVRVLDNGYWYLEDFFRFQYAGREGKLNLKNRVHKAVLDVFFEMHIPLSSVRGLENIEIEKGNFMPPYEFEVNLRSI